MPTVPTRTKTSTTWPLSTDSTCSASSSLSAVVDLATHRLLADRMTTPICLDESIDSPESAREALATRACSVICVKPSRLGGLGATLDLVESCTRAGVPLWMGGMFESGYARGVNTTLAASARLRLARRPQSSQLVPPTRSGYRRRSPADRSRPGPQRCPSAERRTGRTSRRRNRGALRAAAPDVRASEHVKPDLTVTTAGRDRPLARGLESPNPAWTRPRTCRTQRRTAFASWPPPVRTIAPLCTAPPSNDASATPTSSW